METYRQPIDEEIARRYLPSGTTLEDYNPYEPTFQSRTVILRYAKIHWQVSAIDAGTRVLADLNMDGDADTEHFDRRQFLFYSAAGEPILDQGTVFRFDVASQYQMFEKSIFNGTAFFVFDVTVPNSNRFI